MRSCYSCQLPQVRWPGVDRHLTFACTGEGLAHLARLARHVPIASACRRSDTVPIAELIVPGAAQLLFMPLLADGCTTVGQVAQGTAGCVYAQVRVPGAEVHLIVRSLVDSLTSWQDALAKYPAQKASAEEDGAADDEDAA